MEGTAKAFSSMDNASQLELMKNIGACLKDNGINAKVEIFRETVCALSANEIDDKTLLKVEKELPDTESDKAKAFNDAVKSIIEGISGVEIKVGAVLGAGSKY